MIQSHLLRNAYSNVLLFCCVLLICDCHSPSSCHLSVLSMRGLHRFQTYGPRAYPVCIQEYQIKQDYTFPHDDEIELKNTPAIVPMDMENIKAPYLETPLPEPSTRNIPSQDTQCPRNPGKRLLQKIPDSAVPSPKRQCLPTSMKTSVFDYPQNMRDQIRFIARFRMKQHKKES